MNHKKVSQGRVICTVKMQIHESDTNAPPELIQPHCELLEKKNAFKIIFWDDHGVNNGVIELNLQ